MTSTPFEISYYDGAWINITPYVKQWTVDDAGIQKVPTLTALLRSSYSNLSALLTSHHKPIRVLIAPDLTNYYRIFYGNIWHPHDGEPVTGTVDHLQLALDARGVAQRLADDEVSYDYWGEQAGAYPTTLWTYLTMLRDILLQPDSGYDTGIAVDYGAGAITNAVDSSATFKSQTILDAVRAICDRIGYDGYTELNVNTPTLYLRPFGSTASVASLVQPFTKSNFDAGSLDDVINYVTVKGGTDIGMPIGDRFTELAISKYSPAIWSVHIYNGTGNTTLNDYTNAQFTDVKLGAGSWSVKGRVQTVDSFAMYLELDPTLNAGSGVYNFDCQDRLTWLTFDVMHIVSSPAGAACKFFFVYLTDGSGNRIRYWWRCANSYLLQPSTPYHVEIPVGPQAQTKIGLFRSTDTGGTWIYDDAGFTTFDWSDVVKIRFHSVINTMDSIATKDWGLVIDNLQFLGGYEIDPFASYAEELSAVTQAWRYDATTFGYYNETTDINSAATNDVALPPYNTTLLGDTFYFGMVAPFSKILLKVSTAGVYSGITLQWQYWNGTAWTALSTIQDGTSMFKVAGTNWIAWDMPVDWQRFNLQTMTYYWIRAIVTTFATPSITTAPLGEQGWIETGLHPPIFDPAAIASLGMHYQTLNDATISSFEVAQREGWRVINNLKLPIPVFNITKPALNSVVRPSNIVTVTDPHFGINAQEMRVINVKYAWTAQNKRVYQTIAVTGKTTPLPPIWATTPELRLFTK
jgi:hypothetical protein